MIEKYQFGSITINGKTYEYDVEVRQAAAVEGEPGFQGLKVLPWWREKSHIIDVEDIRSALNQKPDLIIIGTGESGLAEIAEKAKEEIGLKNIGLIIERTEKAIKTFNELIKREKEKGGMQRKIIGLFHLTC